MAQRVWGTLVSQELFAMVFVMLPLRIFMSLMKVKMDSELPRDFLRRLEKEKVLDGPLNKSFTMQNLFEELLPTNVHHLIDDCKLDKMKFNHLPTKLNPTDSFLHLCDPGGMTKNFQTVLFGAIICRRLFNEGCHMLLLLDAYEYYGAYPRRRCLSAYAKHVSTDGFLPSYRTTLQSMLDGYDEERFLWAANMTVEIMGIQPRTGYICPPVLSGKDRLQDMAKYLPGVIARLQKQPSLQSALTFLPEVAHLQSDGFHLYQIELVMRSWSYHRADLNLRSVAGPGMLPLCLSMMGRGDVYFSDEFEAAEVEPEDEGGTGSQQWQTPKRQKTSLRAGTWKDRRSAVSFCTYLLGLLLAHNVLLVCVCEHLKLDSNIVDYDELEYFICELRRFVVKPRQRQSKCSRSNDKRCTDIYDHAAEHLLRCQDVMRLKILNRMGTSSVASMLNAKKVV